MEECLRCVGGVVCWGHDSPPFTHTYSSHTPSPRSKLNDGQAEGVGTNMSWKRRRLLPHAPEYTAINLPSPSHQEPLDYKASLKQVVAVSNSVDHRPQPFLPQSLASAPSATAAAPLEPARCLWPSTAVLDLLAQQVDSVELDPSLNKACQQQGTRVCTGWMGSGGDAPGWTMHGPCSAERAHAHMFACVVCTASLCSTPKFICALFDVQGPQALSSQAVWQTDTAVVATAAEHLSPCTCLKPSLSWDTR